MVDEQTPAWITVKTAARIVGRAERTIYRWIDRNILASDTDGEGRTIVPSKAVGRVALAQRRGRPRGVPTRR